jgi:hypothetical protein
MMEGLTEMRLLGGAIAETQGWALVGGEPILFALMQHDFPMQASEFIVHEIPLRQRWINTSLDVA